MEWHLNIPKILHVYWGGGNLPYLRYMTVRSFMNHNPDWEVILWHPENMIIAATEGVCVDYLPKLVELPIQKRVFDEKNHGFHIKMTEQQISDLLSYYVLSTIGGVWADMDIIFFKSMTELAVNSVTNQNKKTFVCMNGTQHSIGFLMGCVDNKFFGKAVLMSKQNFNSSDLQCIGSTMLNKYFPNLTLIERISSVVNIDMDVVYSYRWNQTEDYLTKNLRFTENSIGAHWFGGHPIWKKFNEQTNGGLKNLSDNIIGNLLKNESTYDNGNET